MKSNYNLVGTTVSRQVGTYIVLVDIQDSGIGMDKELQDTVLKLESSSSSVQNGGCGLGLLMSHRLVQRYEMPAREMTARKMIASAMTARVLALVTANTDSTYFTSV